MVEMKNATLIPDWRNFIGNAPLYAKIAFDISDFKHHVISHFCQQIEIYCPRCRTMRLFDRQDSQGRVYGFGPNEINPPEECVFELNFSCSEEHCHCPKNYFFHCQHTANQLILTKIGEWPSLSPRIDRAIKDTFPESADLLKKGMACLKEGYGVGAFAYFRQVLENHIESLLKAVEDYANETNDAKIVEKIADLRKESQMSKKIAIAKDALPAILMVNGQNPLGTIYGCLSEDIHRGTDEECLEKAQIIYTSMAFILGTLAQFKQNRRGYAENIKHLQRTRGVTSNANGN